MNDLSNISQDHVTRSPPPKLIHPSDSIKDLNRNMDPQLIIAVSPKNSKKKEPNDIIEECMAHFDLIINRDMDTYGGNINTNNDSSLSVKIKTKKRKTPKSDNKQSKESDVPSDIKINTTQESTNNDIASKSLDNRTPRNSAITGEREILTSDEIFIRQNEKLIKFLIENCNNGVF